MPTPTIRRPRLRQLPIRRTEAVESRRDERYADHIPPPEHSTDPVAELLHAQLGNSAALAWWRKRGGQPLQWRADAQSEARADALGEQLRGFNRLSFSRNTRRATKRAMPLLSPLLSAQVQARVATVLAQKGMPLPHEVQSSWHADLTQVRLHDDGFAAQAAAAVGARAFAWGHHIVWGKHAAPLHTAQGMQLLSHEVGHVLHQRGTTPVIERQDETESDEDRPTVIVISAPPPLWFTFLDGRYVLRVQADYVAQELLGWSTQDTLELWRARRRPEVSDPRLPADRFIDAIEAQAGLAFLPEARAELEARGALPLLPYEDAFYAIPLRESDLVRWFGPAQWAEYLARPSGTGTSRRIGEEHAETLSGAEGGFAHPIEPRRRVLASNAELSSLYLLLLEHFTGLQISAALQRQARDGLNARELAPLLESDARRAVLTDLFTQGWVEFREAGGSDLLRFEPLIERILEQYLRGNISARANLLRIGHGIPERSVLGIAHRRSRLLLYDDMGMPMQGLAGIALRDVGFIGYDPSGMAAPSEGAEEEVTEPLSENEIGEALTRNLFAQALGVDDSVMIAQAAQAIYNNLERVAHEVEDDLAQEIRDALGPTLFVLAMFMLGHATARLLMRSPNPITIAIGLALEGLLRVAGYLMGLEFLGATFDALLRAAFHMSRVHNDAEGNPTRLSELHIAAAARPLATLITNVAIAMGMAAFGATLRRIRAGGTRGVIENPADGVLERAVEEAPGSTRPTSAPVEAPSTSARRLRPGFATRLRARLWAAVMRGVVEAAPITGGTGAGPSAPLGEVARSGTSSAPRVTAVEPRPSTPAMVETPAAEPAPIESTAPEVAAPEVTAPETTSPSTSVAPTSSPTVWVNSSSGVFHRSGSRWYGRTTRGSYMSEAEARAQGFTEAGSARAAPPTGVYEVTRPERGEPRVVIRARIEERADRAGLEHEMMSAAEYGIAELAGYHRAHSTGAGLGAESGEGIRLAPGELVNQTLQRRGIEAFIRSLADIAADEGVGIHLTTETITHPRGLRLASIHYAVEAITSEGRVTLFDAVIEVRTNGQARAGVRMAGSDAYTFGPWFAE